MSLWLQRADLYLDAHPVQKRILLALSIPSSFVIILLIFVWIETPGKKALRAIQNPEPSVVFTTDSVLIGRYVIQERSVVKKEEVSPAVFDAVISTEDVRFYDHGGIDFQSFGRVLIKSLLLQDESSGGGSTITQQLAKNIYPRKRYWMFSMLVNKLREITIARRLENIFSKDEILMLYLNTIPFADNVYGIEAAAKRFFSVSAKELNPGQAALLIGMLKATHNYNPRLFPDPALKRRNVVLSQMVKYDRLPVEAFDTLKSKPLELSLSEIKQEITLAPYYRDILKAELEAWFEENQKPDGSSYNLYTDGLQIVTHLDSKMQRFAEKAVVQQMTDVQKSFDSHWGKEDPWGDNPAVIWDAVKRTKRYRTMKEDGVPDAEIKKVFATPVEMRIFKWDGPEVVTMSPLDSVRHHLRFLNAGFLVMEPGTGAIKAWVGGIDHGFFQYDHVKLSTKRQVGSIFKPIVYAAALEQGASPCELIDAGQETYIDDEGDKWTPRNTNYDYQVQYSMRGALAYSVNTVAVKLINRAGVDNTIALAQRMGIKSEMPDVPSIALGSSSISLLEMTSAYAAFANDGMAVEPIFLKEIRDRDGNVIYKQGEASQARAMSPATAQMVRHMMQTVVHEGTASRIRWKYGVYNDLAAKTGTTQANADGWFMAITPGLVMGSWVGAEDMRIRFRDTQLGQGASTALPITAYFMRELNNEKAYRSITKAKFTALPKEQREKLSCDLYELSDALWLQIEKTVIKRDSVIQADTLVPPPPTTFLQTLYERKKRILMASQAASLTPDVE